MNKEKQIEEIFNIIVDGIVDGEDNNGVPTIKTCCEISKTIYNAGYRKQREGEWVLEYETYGKMICSTCKEEAPLTYELDNLYQLCTVYVKKQFCPNCGAKMKGGAE